MKKLFYRLVTSRSCARLLSILALVVIDLYYPSASFAVVYCKDNLPNTPCRQFPGLVCPPTTTAPYNAYIVKCSSQGGASGTGSTWNAAINIGQLGWGMVLNADDNVDSLCGEGYFDIQQDSLQPSLGTYTPSGEDPQPQAAQFFFDEWQCSCLQIGACESGVRTSTSTCPTIAFEGPNLAGCTGKITVLALDGTPLRKDGEGEDGCAGTDGCAIRYGDNLGGLDGESCPTEFPAGGGLGENEMARVTQVCTADTDQKNERFVDVDVRATNSANRDYESQTTEFGVLRATCTPRIIDPLACDNVGQIWINFQVPAPPALGEKCVPNSFKCGGAFGGRQPDRCRVSKGRCECRCQRCTEDGSTLVNLYSAEQGAYVISSSISGNAYECPLKFEQ